MNPVVYKIEFPDQSCYVGATTRFSRRRADHLKSFRKGRAVNLKLTAAFNEHQTCLIYVVASAPSLEVLHELEAQVIRDHNPSLNFNLTPEPIRLCPATPRRVRAPRKPHQHLPGSVQPSKAFGPFESITAAAKELGILRKTVRRHAHLGYEGLLAKLEADKHPTPKVDRTKRGPPDPRKRLDLAFVLSGWHTKEQARRICGVSMKVYEKRRALGWTVEAALTTAPSFIQATKYPGVNISAIARKYGLTPAALFNRRRAGWPLLQALGIIQRAPPQRPEMKKRIIKAGGNKWTLDQWAAHLGIPTNTIHKRLSYGWTNEEAVGIKLRPSAVKVEKAKAEKLERAERKAARQITYKGITGSISEVCRHYGAQDSTVRSRIALGWPVDEAFEVPLHNYRHQPKKSS